MTRYMRNTVTGAVICLSDDDDDGYQALVTQKQSSGQGAGEWPLYEETSSADVADEYPAPISGGGSVDLSVIGKGPTINKHSLRITGDIDNAPATELTAAWDDDFYRVVFRGVHNGATE